jgi:NADPH-dependent 2,4-dienoyl-CoA reductase/sulfur reductase-like enzyme
MADLAAEIKESISIPVIAVGRINLRLGEELLREGKADLIAIGRGHIADPQLLKKASEGRFDEIRPCLSCNVCVDDLTMLDVTLHCSVNACVGQERTFKVTKAVKIKNVLIAGGGPAGLEAAITAALRGHKVIIYEQKMQLGGKLMLAATPPHKDEIGPFKDYLVSQVKKYGIQVELGKKVTLSIIRKLQPDVLVLAAGSLPLFPKIPGIDSPNVVLAEEVLSGKETGQKVIVIGGGLVGCETAEFLAQQKKNVTIVEMLGEIATGVGHSFKAGLLNRLSSNGVTMFTGMQCKIITVNSAVIASKSGDEKTIYADTIVLAVGAKPNRELAKIVAAVVPEIHIVGDCLEPRRIINAIGEGHRAGMMI